MWTYQNFNQVFCYVVKYIVNYTLTQRLSKLKKIFSLLDRILDNVDGSFLTIDIIHVISRLVQLILQQLQLLDVVFIHLGLVTNQLKPIQNYFSDQLIVRVSPSCRSEQRMQWRQRRLGWWDLWPPMLPSETQSCRTWPSREYRSQWGTVEYLRIIILSTIRILSLTSPRTVEKAQASSTMMDILRWGDSWTVWGVWTWRLETASVWGRMQVEIMRASMWTAISSTVQTAKERRRPVGMFWSIWISTMATMAKPANKAEVLLEAFSLALLRLRFFHW